MGTQVALTLKQIRELNAQPIRRLTLTELQDLVVDAIDSAHSLSTYARLVTTRWRGGDKQRLYLKTASGTAKGYLELSAGEFKGVGNANALHLEDVVRRRLQQEALAKSKQKRTPKQKPKQKPKKAGYVVETCEIKRKNHSTVAAARKAAEKGGVIRDRKTGRFVKKS